MIEGVEGIEWLRRLRGLRGLWSLRELRGMCNVNEYLINDLHLLYGKILLLDQFLL